MCGLNAIFNPSGICERDQNYVDQMNKSMIYRGPDSQYLKAFDSLVIGHVRLSIVGLENGTQPISNEDNTIWLICNGEIYNYLELKAELEQLGHQFKTSSDSEIIIHLYEQYGLDFFDYLIGMFAFILWDDTTKELLFSRDRYGEKPLYYSKTTSGLVISSEMKSINNIVLQSSSLNKQYIKEVVEFSHPVSMQDTLFNEIKKVKPGYYIRCKGDIFQEIEYNFSEKINLKLHVDSSKSIYQNTYELICKSVERQLNVEVPIAVMLSGGIDSSTIASISKKYRNEVHAICVGYEGDYTTVDERSVAKRFAKEKGLIWHELQLNQNDYENYFEEYISIIDEPIADPAAFAQWGIFKKASELGFKVLLSGIGSDEIFYGYNRHNVLGEKMMYFDNLQKYFPYKGKNLYKYLIYNLIKNKEKIKFISPSDFKKHFSTFKDFDKKEYGAFFEEVKDFPIEIFELYSSLNNGVERVYDYLSSSWLTNNCLLQSDKLAMGNSIEVRTPFTDYNLTSYLKQLDFDLKYKTGQPKWFLKQVLKNELPDYILHPHKKGFSPPYNFIDEIVKSKKYSSFFKKNYTHFNELVVDSLLKRYNIY